MLPPSPNSNPPPRSGGDAVPRKGDLAPGQRGRVRSASCGAARGTLAQMSPPEPMFSASSRSWPRGGDWVLHPDWDGSRLLIEVAPASSPRAWSRHGTSLTSRLADLLEPFAELPGSSVFDDGRAARAAGHACRRGRLRRSTRGSMRRRSPLAPCCRRLHRDRLRTQCRALRSGSSMVRLWAAARDHGDRVA